MKDNVTNSRDFHKSDENLTDTSADLTATFETPAGTASGADTATAADTASAADTATPSRSRRNRFAVAAALVPALVMGGAVAASAHKTVELDVDGNITTVSTWAGSVEGLLADEDITLGEHDELAPGAGAALTEGSVVVVRIADPVEVMIDGQATTIWTTLDSAADVLADLQASGRNGSLLASSRSLSAGRDPLSIPLAIGADVTVLVDGTENTQHFADATTLGEALTVFGVTVSDTDEVVITAGQNGAVTVKVTRIVNGERTEVQGVAFETETRETADLYKGQTRVVQAGQQGERTVVFATVTVDGVETQATELSNTVAVAPVSKIVESGTKARPVATASASLGSAPAGVWASLAQCESGGNPAAVSASGTYYGLYQFSIGTWNAVGGSGLPSQATAAEQTMRAQILQSRSGWGQWPACAAKLGLL